MFPKNRILSKEKTSLKFNKFLCISEGQDALIFGVLQLVMGLGQKVPGSKPGQPLIYCGSKVC